MGIHAASAFYDLPAFRAGASTLRPFERDEVGDVSGRRLLHLQCHMGQDTLSWARLGASLLNPGGFLYLVEFHPFADVLGDDGRTVEHDYFDTRAQHVDHPYTYTDGPALTRTRSVQWHHPLGEVITALARAGLRLDFLHERDTTLFPHFAALEPSGGAYRFPAGRPRVPLMYSLRATRPVA